jgi:hypothetical protein
VLWDNYKKRAPVPTRGGKVTYEESPRMYNFHYVFLAIFGLSFLLAVIVIAAFSR